MGWINSSSLSEEFLKILSNMKIGEVSKPIRKQNKIIFLKLNDKKNLSYTEKNMKQLNKSSDASPFSCGSPIAGQPQSRR